MKRRLKKEKNAPPGRRRCHSGTRALGPRRCPRETGAPRTRHRRAASASVASTSRMGGAAADARDVRSRRSGSRTNGLVSFAMTDDTEDTQNTRARPDAPRSSPSDRHSLRSRTAIVRRRLGPTGRVSSRRPRRASPRLRSRRTSPRSPRRTRSRGAWPSTCARRRAGPCASPTRWTRSSRPGARGRRDGDACLRGRRRARGFRGDGWRRRVFGGRVETEAADRKRDHSRGRETRRRGGAAGGSGARCPSGHPEMVRRRREARGRGVRAAARVARRGKPARRNRRVRRRRRPTIVGRVFGGGKEGHFGARHRDGDVVGLRRRRRAPHRGNRVHGDGARRVGDDETRLRALRARARRLPPATKEEAADDANRRAADAADACLGAARAAADAAPRRRPQLATWRRPARRRRRIAWHPPGAMVGGGDGPPPPPPARAPRRTRRRARLPLRRPSSSRAPARRRLGA